MQLLLVLIWELMVHKMVVENMMVEKMVMENMMVEKVMLSTKTTIRTHPIFRHCNPSLAYLLIFYYMIDAEH